MSSSSVILRRLAEPDLAEAFQAGLPAVDVAGLRREPTSSMREWTRSLRRSRTVL